MRSWWPIPASKLDNKRLLGEHNELLIMGRSIAGLSKGWKNHPETKRWVGHSKAMKARHDELADEMIRRGMNHKSPWPDELIDESHPPDFPATMWEPLDVVKGKLEAKMGCTLDDASWGPAA